MQLKQKQCSPCIRKSLVDFPFEIHTYKNRTHGLCTGFHLESNEYVWRQKGRGMCCLWHWHPACFSSHWLFPFLFHLRGEGEESDLILLSGVAEHRIRLPTSHESRNHILRQMYSGTKWFLETPGCLVLIVPFRTLGKKSVSCMVLPNSPAWGYAIRGDILFCCCYCSVEKQNKQTKRLRHLFSQGLCLLAFLSKA